MTNLGSPRVTGCWEGHLFSSVTEFSSLSRDGPGVPPTHCCFSSSEFPFTKLFGFLDEKHGNTRFVFTGKIAHSFSLESEELGRRHGRGVWAPCCMSRNVALSPSCLRSGCELGQSVRHSHDATDVSFLSLYSPVSEIKKERKVVTLTLLNHQQELMPLCV